MQSTQTHTRIQYTHKHTHSTHTHTYTYQITTSRFLVALYNDRLHHLIFSEMGPDDGRNLLTSVPWPPTTDLQMQPPTNSYLIQVNRICQKIVNIAREISSPPSLLSSVYFLLTYTQINTYTKTHTHIHIHSHTHTYTHTHSPVCPYVCYQNQKGLN